MKNNNLKLKIIFTFLIAVLIFTFLFLILGRRGENKNIGALDVFAKCLSEKSITMYGADWCQHCQNEKKAFGNSFKYVSYVECPKNPKLCLSMGVEGYPTWILKDGRRFVGEQGLERLSEASGCPLQQLP